jgi:hypothetical protein
LLLSNLKSQTELLFCKSSGAVARLQRSRRALLILEARRKPIKSFRVSAAPPQKLGRVGRGGARTWNFQPEVGAGTLRSGPRLPGGGSRGFGNTGARAPQPMLGIPLLAIDRRFALGSGTTADGAIGRGSPDGCADGERGRDRQD